MDNNTKCDNTHCGHGAADHVRDGGKCAATNTDAYGQWKCLCVRFAEADRGV